MIKIIQGFIILSIFNLLSSSALAAVEQKDFTAKLCVNENKSNCVLMSNTADKFIWQKAALGTKVISKQLSPQTQKIIINRWRTLAKELSNNSKNLKCVRTSVIELDSKRSSDCSENLGLKTRKALFNEWSSPQYALSEDKASPKAK